MIITELFPKIFCVQLHFEHIFFTTIFLPQYTGVDKMSHTISTTRSTFFQELTPDNQETLLSLTRNKTLHMIDNLYYTVFVENDDPTSPPPGLDYMLGDLETVKVEVIQTREPIEFGHNLYYMLKSYASYNYCTGNPDMYDIFYCKTLPNADTPRIVVQIRAFALWTKGIDEILAESYQKVKDLLHMYACNIDHCRESRIDYCFHTNSLTSVNRFFSRNNEGKVENLHTNLKRSTTSSRITSMPDGTVFDADYVCLGEKKSNNVRARVYDKVKEVIEMGYKSFFFKIWHDAGLINTYDKFCMEYAFEHRNMDYLHKASLAFYLTHGTNPEIKAIYQSAIDNPATTLPQFKTLAKQHMPKVTTILNIEYETKRKFYYYSDDYINDFKLDIARSTTPPQLARIYKILDYRSLFLDYLTSTTLSFYKLDDQGEKQYLAWWQRLRNTKHNGKNINAKLLREYSTNMDKRVVQKRIINSIASNAVYDDRLDTNFIEDLSDFISDISDNKARQMLLYDNNGQVMEKFMTSNISTYKQTKEKKEKLLKNRKKLNNRHE